MVQVALITGGASGMGLAVADALARRGDWNIHVLDLNDTAGAKAQKALGSCSTFHKTNVNDYASLSSVFDAIFRKENRIDFVFANAGIVERDNFYAKHDASGPPPEPNQLSIDIDLKSVVSTTYLAQHYFRLSPSKGKGCKIVMTASCGGLYPSPFCPMYSAAKSGVIQLMRSVAKHFYLHDGIVAHAICPGTVRTNLLDSAGWSSFPEEYFTPVSKIVETVLMLVDGGDMVDAKGNKVTAAGNWGKAVEVNGTNHYFREQPEWCDAAMEAVMKATDVEGLKGF
ncbi:NAD(P)-binding protein [Aulographum hederae CBS 113979]|uniref:NAD(P)-binding protein n=1 Tax=Aulographum hederae CBS 113979 TaxID=1176131 RepID=A0A6G1GP29_9PEZI|nr:NAD(P)-binding protein [Aulographum hederae CBS 113979]